MSAPFLPPIDAFPALAQAEARTVGAFWLLDLVPEHHTLELCFTLDDATTCRVALVQASIYATGHPPQTFLCPSAAGELDILAGALFHAQGIPLAPRALHSWSHPGRRWMRHHTRSSAHALIQARAFWNPVFDCLGMKAGTDPSDLSQHALSWCPDAAWIAGRR